jgi:aldehyde:ferredoxin oxidoreductase
MMYGYAGRILRVDLTDGDISQEQLDLELVHDFIGGWGINNRLFYDIQRPGTDPFSPDNPMIIGVGALVGTPVPGAGKVICTTKSPILTKENRHFIDNAVAGSNRFGVMLKNAGYDHVIITGMAERPVYLKIIDGDAKICDADRLWGKKDVYETTDYLMHEYEESGVISIGKAGENLVRYGMAAVDLSGTLGKFGLGAVMGSKNLKAVVVRGRKGIKVANPKRFMKSVDVMRKNVEKAPFLRAFHMLGIASGWGVQAPLVKEGVWSFKRWTELYGTKKWMEVRGGKNYACSTCLLNCKVDYEIKDGEFKGLRSFTGHYFLPARVGQRLEIEDYRKAVKLLDICNRAGMCYFTASGITNWITRLYEEGIITKRETDGLEPKRDFDTYVEIFEEIINREGLGDIIAEGWYPLSKKITSDRCVGDASKLPEGQLPTIDPDQFVEGTGIFKGADAIQDGRFTALHPQAFSYITDPRPHHGGTQSLHTLPGIPIGMLREDVENMGTEKDAVDRIFTDTPYYGDFNVGRYAKHLEDVMAVHDSMGTCIVYSLFGRFLNVKMISDFYSAATGIEISAEELKMKGERAFNLFKIINIREGFEGRDRCSKIWLSPIDTPDGRVALMDYYRKREISAADIEELLDDYYDERGWSLEAIPTRKKLIELELEEFLI